MANRKQIVGASREAKPVPGPRKQRRKTRHTLPLSPCAVCGASVHIAHRKRAEQALRDSEEQLRHAADLVGLYLYTWEPATGALHWSDEIKAMWGLPPEATANYDLWRAGVHPADCAAVDERVARCLDPAGDGIFEMEYRVNGADRVQRWVSVRGRTTFSRGKPVAHRGVIIDITGRKRAEEALRESESRAKVAQAVKLEQQRFRELLDRLPVYVALLSPEHQVPFANRFFEQRFGKSNGRRCFEYLFNRVEPCQNCESFKVLKTNAPHNWQWTGPDGRNYDIHDVPFTDADGSRMVMEVGIDVTERKRAEAALQAERQRFYDVLETLPAMICLLTPDYRVAFANRSFREKFGEAKGRRCYEQCFGRSGPCEFCESYTVLKTGIPHRWEVVGPDGSVLVAYDFPFTDVDGSPMILEMDLDITEFRKTQSALREANSRLGERTARLQELVAELEHFSYTITHDLKSPLRAMHGFAEMASIACQRGAGKDALEFLGRISSAAGRMDRLVDDALNYSRTVRQELPLENVDPSSLLRGMLDSYPEFHPDKAQIVVEGPLPVVLANEAGLTQCFSNLLGNAVKFVQPGQRADVRVWASQSEGWVRLWVADAGIGISKDMLSRVFDIFSRASKDYEGTGIGLALVRKVVQQMGGSAGVESEEGKGSRFWIELKAGQPKAHSQETTATSVPRPEAATMLYAEDEDGDALFMKLAFEDKGLAGKLQVVGDGRAAINYLSGAGKYQDRETYPVPALVLLDLNLPQVPGFYVLEWMRKHPDYARTPVVMFSSSTRDDDHLKARELGANDFLAKPSSGIEFGSVVDTLRERWMGVTP